MQAVQTQEVAEFGPFWPAGYNLPTFTLEESFRELIELELLGVRKGPALLGVLLFPLGNGDQVHGLNQFCTCCQQYRVDWDRSHCS